MSASLNAFPADATVPSPKLTVLVVTYNHAPFIEAAIDSVLMQETDFDYEIIVSEDCSTDGTREIVQRLREAHPDRIRIILSDRNRNDNSVVRRGVEAARGQYIALLDGDDFWTCKRKLQQQVDFLDHRPDCSLCVHNVNVIYEDGIAPSHRFYSDRPSGRFSRPPPKPVSTLGDIVRADFIPTCSTVFRTWSPRSFPDWYDELPFGDWSLHILNAERGDIGYLDKLMATYRIHSGGVWSADMSLFRRLEDVEVVIDAYDVYSRYLRFAFVSEIREAAADFYQYAAIWFYRAGQHASAVICAWRALGRSTVRGGAKRWKLIPLLAIAGTRCLVGGWGG